MLTVAKVFRQWLPLAASWALMGAEGPLFTWVVASMAEQKINLAAFGSIAFPIALVVEGPIIMLLAASTALCRDWDSYRKVRRFMYAAAGALTLLHVLIAFTPLYDLVAGRLLGVPEDILAPGRLGLQILTPWTASIAYRRFLQGVLIRFGSSRLVMIGTALRLLVLLTTLFLMRASGGFSGIVVGTTGIAAGVVAEAIFARWAVGPILREKMPRHEPSLEPITRSGFLRFYIPLAMTPLLTLFIGPAGAAAMSRMPEADLSLAGWQVVHAIVFLMRSTGFAFNEVVVSQLDRPGARQALRRFAVLLAISTSGLLLLLALTPLSRFVLGDLFQLEPDLMRLCSTALLFAALMPAYQVFQSLFQGRLVHAKRTRGITEAVALYVVTALTGLQVCVWWGAFPGIFAAITVFSIGGILQTLWLAKRANLHA
ncbi:MAG: hypothetical protein ACYSU1_05580 [Planctomycetota bacterium]